MGHAVPTPSEMFSDASGADVARRFESYKTALSGEHQKAAQGGRAFVPEQGIVTDPAVRQTAIAERIDTIGKSVGVDVMASIQGELDALKGVLNADLGKDWSLTFPNATGLVPYDLEAPAKLLVPRLTPLRNMIPREKGIGTGRQYKRITGWSNAGVGGVPDMSPFIKSDTVQTNFGSLALRRGPKITYASDNRSVNYVEQGLSDMVTWSAQFAGQGFQDIRSLSQTALLWAHMGGEERAMLYGRGTAGNGYIGSVTAPTIATSTAGTGGTVAAGTYQVVVTAKGGFGETAVSNTSQIVTTGSTSTITVTVTTEPAGSLGVYNLYVSQAGAAVGTATFQTTFAGTSYVLTTTPSNTGVVNAGATNTSADLNGYDGFLTVQAGSESGYYRRQNAALNAANPGDEFQVAFLALFQSVKADPDHVWADGATMKKLGDLLKTTSSQSYKLNLNGDGHGHFLGSTVVGLENQVTRKMVGLDVHPWMPQGCALIRSETLPIPDSQVNATAQVVNVQEYMAVDWPVIQFTYDQSTYQFGTLVHYAPGWSGLITGIL